MVIIEPTRPQSFGLLHPLLDACKADIVVVKMEKQPTVDVTEEMILNFRPPVVEDFELPKLSSPKDYGLIRANRRH